MKNFILNLVNVKGATVDGTSVNLADKKAASEYFGSWFKQNATSADVVSWCKERIANYNRLIQNLNTLMGEAQMDMVRGMDKAQLQAILAQMETPSE